MNKELKTSREELRNPIYILIILDVLHIIFSPMLFVTDLSLGSVILIITIPFVLLTTILCILLFYTRNRVTKDGNVICRHLANFSNSLFKFDINQIKQIVFIRLDDSGPSKGYICELNLDATNQKCKHFIDIYFDQLFSYFNFRNKHPVKKKTKQLLKEHWFVKDGLKDVAFSKQFFVLFFNKEITNFSHYDFKYSSFFKFYNQMNETLRSSLLGMTRFNEKLLSQIYEKINVPNVIIGKANFLINKDRFKKLYKEDSCNVDFYNLTETNYFEAILERKKHLLNDYLQINFPEQNFYFDGEIDYEG